jgi:hypothetical protein
MSMNESDDYKRGWQRGWNDGFNAAKNHSPVPVYPAQAPIGQASVKCFKCGIVFTGAMGYSCPQTNCPIQPKAT